MERYKIINVKRDGAIASYKLLTLQGRNREADMIRTVSVSRGVEFAVGENFNIIKTKRIPGLDSCRQDVAYAYRTNGKYFVDFQIEPIIPYGIQEFCGQMDNKDRRELNAALRRALISRGTVPSRLLENNLKKMLVPNICSFLGR